MDIRPAARSVEVGHIVYSPALQRTPLGTEVQYLLARYAFETLGNRRYEWKCNALNAPSRRAALRYGFVFEGILRQHTIAKGRSRDTAYYSMLDSEWPARKAAFERWLAADNFDAQGNQKISLNALNGGAPPRWIGQATSRLQGRVTRSPIVTLLAAGFALSLAVFYPGYMTVDAEWVYKAITDGLGDWQSPAMSVLWRMIDPIAPGSMSMFLLMAALYWGELRSRRLHGGAAVRWLGIVTACWRSRRPLS